MLSRRDVVLGAALAISLGANVVLVLRKTEAARTAEPPVAREVKPPVDSAPVQSPLAMPTRVRPPREPAGSGTSSPCPELVAQLEATEAELDKFLPPDERWERHPRSEENEARVRPFLESVFTDGGKGRGYQVECHELVCKIVLDREVARNDWMEAVQKDPGIRGLSDGMMFGRDNMYMTLKAKPPSANEMFSHAFYSALEAKTPAIQACTSTHETPGKLATSIAFDPGTRRLQLTLGDSLAASPLADCVRALLEAAIAATPVPADVTAFETFTWPIVVK